MAPYSFSVNGIPYPRPHIWRLNLAAGPNAATTDVINGMPTNHFIFMGRLASLASFYEGYGIP